MPPGPHLLADPPHISVITRVLALHSCFGILKTPERAETTQNLIIDEKNYDCSVTFQNESSFQNIETLLPSVRET